LVLPQHVGGGDIRVKWLKKNRNIDPYLMYKHIENGEAKFYVSTNLHLKIPSSYLRSGLNPLN